MLLALVETEDAVEYPVTHRAASTTKNYLAQDSAEGERNALCSNI